MKLKKFRDISEGYSPNTTKKILNLFDEWDLGIESIKEGDFCKKNSIVLPNEQHLKEYRVSIKEIYREANVLEDCGVDSVDELEEEDKKLINSFKDMNYDTTFSVFLPSNTMDLKSGAIECASRYLKILSNSCDEVYLGIVDNDSMSSDINKFKTFLKLENITITNENLEFINKVNYRLYKDNNFVNELRGLIEDKGRVEEFFKEWLALL